MGSAPLRFLVLRWRATDFADATEAAHAGRRRTPGAIRQLTGPVVPRNSQWVESTLPQSRTRSCIAPPASQEQVASNPRLRSQLRESRPRSHRRASGAGESTDLAP